MKKTRIKGALSGKHSEVTKQTRMTLQCQGHDLEANLFVVPSLTAEIIIGMDLLREYQAILDVGRGEVTFRKGEPFTLQFVEQAIRAQLPAQCLRLAKHEEVSDAPRQIAELTREEIDCQQRQEILAAIDSRLAEIKDIPENDKASLREVLHRNIEVFSPKTGAIKNLSRRQKRFLASK